MTPIRLRLKELREARGLSQHGLASASGVPQPTISRLERGVSGGVDFAILEKLADALKVNASHLVEHTRRRK